MVQPRGLVFAQPAIDGDAMCGQLPEALTAHTLIRIRHRRDNALDAGLDDSLRAGPRPPGVAARFERHVKGGASRQSAGFIEGIDFRVRLACPFVPAVREDDAVRRDEHGAGHWVGGRPPSAAAGVEERAPHHRLVERRRDPAVRYHFSWNSASTYSAGENGSRSSMPSPTPT